MGRPRVKNIKEEEKMLEYSNENTRMLLNMILNHSLECDLLKKQKKKKKTTGEGDAWMHACKD